VYGDVSRIVANNLAYLGNLRALQAWYAHARRLDREPDPFRRICLEGAARRLHEMVEERVKRLDQLAAAMPRSMAELAAEGAGSGPACRSQQRFHAAWPTIRKGLAQVREAGETDRARVLAALRAQEPAETWTTRVGRLPPAARGAGTRWLQAVVDTCTELWHPA
jgi:UDP-N-acetylglucosamine/UDP-N-acetylgalactosamine diphosphorylase